MIAQLHAHASNTPVNLGFCSVMHCVAYRHPRRLAASQKQANEDTDRKAEAGFNLISFNKHRIYEC